ncbi:MAG TPA: toll/interleukin-1 receptor domain-containing protein [Stellaceae bacterium]|nr:toll/interleukin-1 receptor domain-containing protein [Stellaceae bacterium]
MPASDRDATGRDMPRITISYRREDSLDITGRIFDRLVAHFGRQTVFRDIDNIPPGVDFRRHVDTVLDESDIILAVVGPRWIGPRVNQSRLASPADPVRLEIETALRKDKPLIPVLVSRAAMPRPDQLPESVQDFAYRNAVRIDAGQDFDHHIGRLVRAMERLLEKIDPEGDAKEGAAREDAVDAAPSKQHTELNAELGALREVNRELNKQIAEANSALLEYRVAIKKRDSQIDELQARLNATMIPIPNQQEIGTEILLCITEIGDRRYVESGWAGNPGGKRQIEALSIRPRDGLAFSAIEFRAYAREGRATPWVSNGNYAGGRGRNVPLTGFAVRAAGDFTNRLDVEYEGSFFEGGVVASKRNGELCVSPIDGDPLEAILVRILKR